MMTEVRVERLQPAQVPSRISGRAEEVGPLVIVYAMRFPPLVTEIINQF
jgi:hypothetical protein